MSNASDKSMKSATQCCRMVCLSIETVLTVGSHSTGGVKHVVLTAPLSAHYGA